ncbi:polyphosphate polymerase domain-containing protein [Cellulomonas sp. HD19AZ1]|uniref:polyphosphate polymerase domain-containing protein n=1 Tax=Cellulomonas sp. HD19AZ1 TaxID=2559593 RepID=UPI001F1085F3|nr:polyphosphate polymerase domain-containing protein [Cellulomonas sp. HD19AZ1]
MSAAHPVGTTSAALDRFATVGLDELTARAALQTRVDRKYVLPTRVVTALLAGLDDGTRVLRIDGRQQLAYESVYFDTPDLTSYLGTARRRRRRFKVRTRTYLDTAACFVEVKTRGPRGATVKTRLPYDVDARDRLTADAREFADDVLGEADVPGPADPRFAPTLVSRYRRSTLLLPGGPGRPDARLTLDTGLAWSAAGGGDALALDGLVVVETKTGATPCAADRLLWHAGHRPVRISKYGTGLAALDPRLPSTPWRRVLDRHVTPAPAPG